MIVDPSISQPQPLPTMGVRSSQDIVDHLDKVMAAQPPEVQAAVDHAHGILGLQSPIQQPAVGAESPMAASAPIPAPQGPQPIAASPAGVSPIVDAGSPSDVQPLPTPKPIIASPVTSDPASGLPITPSAPQSSAAPAPLQNPHMANLERMTTEGTGTNKIHNPFLRGLATVGDAIGSGLFPEFARFVPGTSAHHQQLISEEEGQLGQEQKAAKSTADVEHTNAETGLEVGKTANLPAAAELQKAETANYLSEADARKNPDLQVVAHPVIDPTDPSKTPRTGYFNKKTGKMTYGPEIGAAPAVESSRPTVEKLENGDIVAVHFDPATKKSTTEVVYHGDPKIETDITKLEVNGKPHSVVVNKKTGATIKDLGETGEKPPNVNINQGTWSIQEDAQGKPIEYNSKTGETRAVAAGGIQKSGTKEKEDAKLAPGNDAMSYADQYLNSQKYTGSGDEALLEKFFELAKPSSGFRMSQPQIDLLQNSRGYLGSVKAIGHHALTGTWFDDQQRKEIVDTMKNIVNSKGSSAKHPSATATDGASDQATKPQTQAEYDAIKPGTIYIDTDGQQKKKK